MIASFIPGRVRIRNPRFKDPETASTAAALLREHPCVKEVTAHPTTGGLLIEYDPEKLDMESALQALEQIDPEGLECFRAQEKDRGGQTEDLTDADMLKFAPRLRPISATQKEALEYLAMIGVFVVCTGSAFLRSKGLHVYSGLSLAGMTVSHIYKYRTKLKKTFDSCFNY